MIAAIELAMLARLREMATAGAFGDGFRWNTLTSYPEDWDAYLQEEREIRTPAAWVVYAGWNSPERGDDGVVTVDASFGVMVADENLRNEQARRHGGPNAATEPGSYRLAIFAVGCLAGQMLGLDLAGPLEVGANRAVRPTDAMRKRKLAMYATEFTAKVPIMLLGEDDPVALETLHANWDVPAFATPYPIDRDAVATGTQLPDDAHADATDIVQLETEPT